MSRAFPATQTEVGWSGVALTTPANHADSHTNPDVRNDVGAHGLPVPSEARYALNDQRNNGALKTATITVGHTPVEVGQRSNAGRVFGQPMELSS